jgi:hypothetical protein
MSDQMSLFPSKDLPEGKEPSRETETTPLDEMFSADRRYRSSRAYMDMLRFISRFPNYSAFNCFLLHTQNPSITFVATAGRWRKQFGRRPKIDARPLMILAPMSPVRFVYDVKDTEGDPVSPESLTLIDTTGRLPREVYNKTIHNCAVQGIAVRDVVSKNRYPGSAVPLTYDTRKQFHDLNLDAPMKYLILIEKDRALEDKYASLACELGHIFCGHLGIDGKAWWQDRRGTGETEAKIEAESVAFLASRRKGLVAGSEKYLSEYAQQDRKIPVFGLNGVLHSTHYIEEMGKTRWKTPRKKSRYQAE